jgi:hypothetical protein
MSLVVSGGSTWDIIAVNVKRPFRMKSSVNSMNRYQKALCSDHQRSNGIRGTTKDLQDLVRERHQDEMVKEIPVLKTVKDWINADFDTWDKVLNKKDDGSYSVKVSGEELKNSSSKHSKNKSIL